MQKQKLFIKPKFSKFANKELSRNTEQWEQEILEELYSNFPILTEINPNISIQYDKKDEDSGTAFGIITINANNKVLGIPLMVKSYELLPLDILYYKNKFSLLTPQKLESLLSSVGTLSDQQSQTAPVPTVFDAPRVWDPASFFSKVSQQVYPEDKEKVLHTLKDPEIAATYLSTGKKEIVSNISNIQPIQPVEKKDLINNVSNCNVLRLLKLDDNKYNLLIVSDNTKRVFHKVLNYEQAKNILNSFFDNANELLYKSKDIIWTNRKTPLIKPLILEELVWQPEKVERGVILVEAARGEILKGVVMPMKGYDEKLKDNIQIWTNNKNYMMSDKIKGELVDTDIDSYITASELAPGTRVSFYNPDEKICYLPFVINSIYTISDQIYLKGADFYANPTVFILVDKLQRITPIETAENKIQISNKLVYYGSTYFLPTHYRIFNLGTLIRPSEVTKQFLGIPYPETTISIIKVKSKYIIKGEPLKSLFSIAVLDGVDRNMVKFVILAFGASEQDAEDVLNKIEQLPNNKVTITNLEPFQKVAIDVNRDIVNFCNKVKVNLVKEAATLPPDSIDAILSLGFINPHNLQQFINNIPLFQNAENKLTELLLMSRLGLKTVNENDLLKVLKTLSDIISEFLSYKNLYMSKNE